jgi:hypothetical protein
MGGSGTLLRLAKLYDGVSIYIKYSTEWMNGLEGILKEAVMT